MKHMRYILFLFVALTLASCSMTQKVHFNKDWSGSVISDFDYSMLYMMAGDSLSEIEGADAMDMTSVVTDLARIDGITNVQVLKSEEGYFKFSYDFEDIDALNAASASGDMGNNSGLMESPEEVKPVYSVKGKKLVYSPAPMDLGSMDEMSEEMDMGDEELPMGEMMSLIQYQVVMTFEGKVKKLKTESGAKLSPNGQQIDWNPDFGEYSSGAINPKMTMVVK